ncbi:LysR family transcriptional regulator [Paraburkholderia sp. GAS334]|jgi:DNA-binding transcriptional LysR family regulator|uniref:LysR family transcriptional regulator n=1 Tax=unclassified Paraburkholderia TaxID=2615204 RepID=UPI003D232776
MNLLASIRIFARVAESLNFADAARVLGVSCSVVTRGVAALEAHLNVRLINRTTRRVSLTAAGQIYWQGCIDLLRQLDAMEEMIASATSQSVGSLKIAAPSSYATTDLGDILAAYHREEPLVNFELTVFDNMKHVVANDFDVCFTAEHRLRDSSLICRSLAQTQDVIVASPAYLARRRAPKKPQDLSDHDILLGADAPSRYWEFRDTNGAHRVVLRPVMNAQSPAVVARAAEAGLGIARLSRSLIHDQIESGTLVELLGNFLLDSNERTVWILYSRRRHMPLSVRSFVDFVVSRYREEKSSQTRSDTLVPA